MSKEREKEAVELLNFLVGDIHTALDIKKTTQALQTAEERGEE